MTPPRPLGSGLALVGLRGTGKSTVGRIVAERLGWTFLDSDVQIEATAGRPIRDIFTELGEPAFRDFEERALDELTQRPNAVLATGGGAILRETNRNRLRSFGFVVWLAADPSILAQRLLADARGLADRPALTNVGTLDELATVLAARTPIYSAVADAVIETGLRSPVEVAQAILDVWHAPQE